MPRHGPDRATVHRTRLAHVYVGLSAALALALGLAIAANPQTMPAPLADPLTGVVLITCAAAVAIAFIFATGRGQPFPAGTVVSRHVYVKRDYRGQDPRQRPYTNVSHPWPEPLYPDACEPLDPMHEEQLLASLADGTRFRLLVTPVGGKAPGHVRWLHDHTYAVVDGEPTDDVDPATLRTPQKRRPRR